MPDISYILKNGSKGFAPLAPQQGDNVLTTHASNAEYLQTPLVLERKQDNRFTSNNGIWEAITLDRLRAEINVTLDSFFLFEWLPRSPGLFYTPAGVEARELAMKSVLEVKHGVVTFNPHGKGLMLDGGIGNIRVKPFRIGEDQLYLMGASSNGLCHEGFPVAISPTIYRELISEISERGAVVRDIVGRLQFLPSLEGSIYDKSLDVPKLYLLVDEVRPAAHPKSRRMEGLQVSVSITFQSAFEGNERLYACYADFTPGDRTSFKRAIDWMANDYVYGKYSGVIVSDFDEQQSHFPDAPFSLAKVMDLTLTKREMSSVVSAERIAERIYAHQIIIKQDRRIIIMDNSKTINVSHSQNVTITMAEHMHNVQTTVNQNLQQSPQSPEIKGLVEELIKQINDLSKTAPREKVEEMTTNLTRLSDELKSANPKKRWYEASLEGIREAAQSVGAMATPVIETVVKLLPLLTS